MARPDRSKRRSAPTANARKGRPQKGARAKRDTGPHYDDVEPLRINNVRLIWPHLFELPTINNKLQEKYSLGVLLDQEEHAEEIKELRKRIARMAKRLGCTKLSQLKNICLNDCTFEGLEDENLLQLNLKTKKTPYVVNAAVQPVENPADVYAGMYGNVKLEIWSVCYEGANTVSAEFVALQTTKPGEPLVGGQMSYTEAVEGFEDETDGIEFDEDGGDDDDQDEDDYDYDEDEDDFEDDIPF